MAKFAEAEARIFKDKFVGSRCKYVMRASGRKVIEGKIKCRRCECKKFKSKRKK